MMNRRKRCVSLDPTLQIKKPESDCCTMAVNCRFAIFFVIGFIVSMFTLYLTGFYFIASMIETVYHFKFWFFLITGILLLLVDQYYLYLECQHVYQTDAARCVCETVSRRQRQLFWIGAGLWLVAFIVVYLSIPLINLMMLRA